jgi:glycosyltransferase involved in cell wall biosynthesis
MRICLVATFPPSGRQLNEYAFHIARELHRNPDIDLTILADELSAYDFATDESGKPLKIDGQSELPGFNVIRCWRFGSLATPARLLHTIRGLKPDIVWFNLVFSSFATPDMPVAAFAGLSTPALVRAAGFYTHITLHHILEHVDFAAAGFERKGIFRIGTGLATRTLLKANSVSVLLPSYRRTLVAKYAARNVLLGTHGTFASVPIRPDFTKRGNPDKRILAIGHWGTYKRLETMMEAFPIVLERIPEASCGRGQSSHTGGILGVDPRCAATGIANRVSRLCSGGWYSGIVSINVGACAAVRFRDRLQRSGSSSLRVRPAHCLRQYSRSSHDGE